MTTTLSVDDAVDMTRLATWLAANGLERGPIEDPVILDGGTQNLLIRFRMAGRELVLRRPPLHPRPNNDRLLLREAAVLRALATTSIPHPRLLAVCTEPGVCTPTVFLVMEAVHGFNPVDELPHAFNDPSGRDLLALRATDGLARIGAVDHESIGLADFGRPTGFLQRQVNRWVAEHESYLGLDGYPGAPLPGFDSVRDYLAARVPPTFRPGLMHGDYHFGNLLFDCDSADLVAVLDWEMATIGDPLLDLGRYLAMWPDEHEVIMTSGGIWESWVLPDQGTVVERYAQGSARPVEHLDWYVVMGCFKLGIILEGSYARACAGQTSAAAGQTLHDIAVRLFERARRLVGQQ